MKGGEIMKTLYIVLGVVLIAVIGGGFFLFNSNTNSTRTQNQVTITEEVEKNKVDTQQEESGVGANKSALSARYLDYSEENLAQATANNGKSVLFFAALAWCPSCQAADKDIKANFSKVPEDITILRVDYDTAKEMKKKFAITMQDTFVQVDSQGKEITRWNSGGQGVQSLLANAK